MLGNESSFQLMELYPTYRADFDAENGLPRLEHTDIWDKIR